jgi:hypothetical protein
VDFSSIVASLDLDTVSSAVTGIAALLMVEGVVRAGAKIVLEMIRG